MTERGVQISVSRKTFEMLVIRKGNRKWDEFFVEELG